MLKFCAYQDNAWTIHYPSIQMWSIVQQDKGWNSYKVQNTAWALEDMVDN